MRVRPSAFELERSSAANQLSVGAQVSNDTRVVCMRATCVSSAPRDFGVVPSRSRVQGAATASGISSAGAGTVAGTSSAGSSLRHSSPGVASARRPQRGAPRDIEQGVGDRAAHDAATCAWPASFPSVHVCVASSGEDEVPVRMGARVGHMERPWRAPPRLISLRAVRGGHSRRQWEVGDLDHTTSLKLRVPSEFTWQGGPQWRCCAIEHAQSSGHSVGVKRCRKQRATCCHELPQLLRVAPIAVA